MSDVVLKLSPFLAQKWRPSQLEEVVGQQAPCRILSQTVRLKKFYPAYLFSGSRGVGKTTLARLFAKLARCTNPREGSGELLRACTECEACRSFVQGIDFMELDGASHNGVDSIREIREQAQYAPVLGSYKIYLIDEVHMLSMAAFNALLKILEEPPPFVVFLFATTELHKIPETILSRCQKFELQQLSFSQIQAHLEKIFHTETQLILSPEICKGLQLIARKAAGGLRDALCLLDQVLTYCSAVDFSEDKVRASLGLSSEETVFEIFLALLEKKAVLAIEHLNFAEQQGNDLKSLAQEFLEWFHQAFLWQVKAPLSPFLFRSESQKERFEKAVQSKTLEELELLFQVFHQNLDPLLKSQQPKLLWDILLIKGACADFLAYLHHTAQNTDTYQKTVQSHSCETQEATKEVPLVSEKTAEQEKQRWDSQFQEWLGHIQQQRPLLSALLEHTSLGKVGQEEITIQFGPEKSHFKSQLQGKAYFDSLSQLASQFFKKPMKIVLLLGQANTESLALQREREAVEKKRERERQIREMPLLREADKLFGGTWGGINDLS